MAFLKYVVLCVFISSVCIEGQIYEGSTRNTRQRRPSISYIDNDEVEDVYVSGNTKRPTYIEGGNQWKPMYNIQPTTRTQTKYRSKPHTYSSKYQQSNTVNPSEYYPKTYQPSTINFIANQTLLVADPHERIIKPSPSYKKPKYQYVPKKHYSSQSYEVHEESEEVPDYISNNQFRFPLPKPGQATTKPILYSEMVAQKPKQIQYAEMVGSDKHFHHVHYHDTMEEALKASATKNGHGRQYRGYPSTSSSSRKYY